MRATLLKFRNLLGLETLDIVPGALTVIEGENGVGKTSVVEGLKALIGGGHDATLVRTGADVAEVGLVLDDGEEFDKRITAAGSTLSGHHPDLGRIGSPKARLEHLIDGLGANPIAILTAAPKDRAAMILQTVPLTVTGKELQAAVGDVYPVPVEAPGHALVVIDRLARAIYDERTGVNRLAKEARTTAEQLQGSVPAEAVDATALAAEIDAKTVAYEACREEFATGRDRIQGETNAEIRRLEGLRDHGIGELQRQIEALREETVRAVWDCQAKGRAEVDRLRDEVQPKGNALREEIAALTERATRVEGDAKTRRLIAVNTTRAEAEEAKAAKLTAALTGLEALKGKIAAKIPVKGLEIRDGAVLLNGVPFERANKAAQVQAAVNLAALRAREREVPLILVDGAECLDSKTFERFEAAAAKAGLQLIVTKVSDGPLTIRTVNPPDEPLPRTGTEGD